MALRSVDAMPKSGRPFTVRMSNCGPLGWVSDENGYRYQARARRKQRRHLEDGAHACQQSLLRLLVEVPGIEAKTGAMPG
jgi:alkylated DNA repair dioxygenase AlkB